MDSTDAGTTAFSRIETYIKTNMRAPQMKSVYQPVMLATLLVKDGKASVRDIALSLMVACLLTHKEILDIEEYDKMVERHPGMALTNKLLSRTGQTYELIDFAALSQTQVSALLRLLHETVVAYETNPHRSERAESTRFWNRNE